MATLSATCLANGDNARLSRGLSYSPDSLSAHDGDSIVSLVHSKRFWLGSRQAVGRIIVVLVKAFAG